MRDDDVQAKARAAALWCERATSHEKTHGEKPWRYLLIPPDDIAANNTLHGFDSAYRVQRINEPCHRPGLTP